MHGVHDLCYSTGTNILNRYETVVSAMFTSGYNCASNKVDTLVAPWHMVMILFTRHTHICKYLPFTWAMGVQVKSHFSF